MLKAIPHRFGWLGLVGALLVALATVALPAEGRAWTSCEPEAAASADLSAGVAIAAPCDTDDCGDCAGVCNHGCCHAPHVGVVAQAAAPAAPMSIGGSMAVTEPLAIRLALATMLERPPRD